MPFLMYISKARQTSDQTRQTDRVLMDSHHAVTKRGICMSNTLSRYVCAVSVYLVGWNPGTRSVRRKSEFSVHVCVHTTNSDDLERCNRANRPNHREEALQWGLRPSLILQTAKASHCPQDPRMTLSHSPLRSTITCICD